MNKYFMKLIIFSIFYKSDIHNSIYFILINNLIYNIFNFYTLYFNKIRNYHIEFIYFNYYIFILNSNYNLLIDKIRYSQFQNFFEYRM